MVDREKVKQGLEHCINESDCRGCVYFKQLMETHEQCQCRVDALALIIDQQNEINAWKISRNALFETVEEQKQIVRCKDCKKRESMYCPFYWRYKGTKYDDWFCDDGELQPNCN